MGLIVINKKKNKGRRIRRNKEQERGILQACIEYLQWRGCLVVRANSGMIVVNDAKKKRVIRLADAGTSDIIACLPGGRFLAVECKTKEGKLSKKQSEFLDRIKKLGGIALVVKSVDELEVEFKRITGGG